MQPRDSDLFKEMTTNDREEDESSTCAKPNYSSIFPSAKIKALLHQEEKIGGIRSSAVSMAGEFLANLPCFLIF